jgi:hypothetical protein
MENRLYKINIRKQIINTNSGALKKISMKNNHLLLISFFFVCATNAQIGIGTLTPDPSSNLELKSTTQGFLPPRMTTDEQAAIANPAIGLTIYNTSTSQLESNKGDGLGGKLWTASSGSGSGTGTGSAYTNVTGAISVNTNINSATVVSGMTSSPPAGTYAVNFNGQYNINPGAVSNFITTAGAKSDLVVAYNQLNELPESSTHAPGFGDGEILFPGVYYCASPASLNGTIILDAQNDPNAVFVIKLGAELDVVANTKVILANGAEAWNVFWLTEGGIKIGASCNVKGTFFSNAGAVAMEAGCVLDGRMLTKSGSVTMVSSIITIPLNTSTINLGVLSAFALFTSVGAVGNTSGSKITGHVGTNVGAISGFDGTETTLDGLEFLPDTPPFPLDSSIFATFSVYQNGVLVANSSRTVITKVNKTDVITIQAIATVTAGQAIDVRWKTNLGILSMANRGLTLIKLQ